MTALASGESSVNRWPSRSRIPRLDQVAGTRHCMRRRRDPACDLGPASGAKPGKDVLHVCADGSGRDRQLGRDLRVGQTRGNQLRDFELAGGERVPGRFSSVMPAIEVGELLDPIE